MLVSYYLSFSDLDASGPSDARRVGGFKDFCRPQEATGGRRIQTFGACFEEADPPFWDSFGEADPPLLGSFGGGSGGRIYYEADPHTK